MVTYQGVTVGNFLSERGEDAVGRIIGVVLLVTDEPCFAAGFASLLERERDADVQVRTLVTEAEGAVEALRGSRADVVVLDGAMAGIDAARLRAVRDVIPSAKGVLLLAQARTRDAIEAAFSAGVGGYILKSAGGTEILDAIRRVGRGQTYLDPHLVAVMTMPKARALVSAIATPSASHSGRVSAREMAVLRRTAYGYSAKEIARDLDISQKSVETYKARAIAKLGLTSRSDIIRYAHQAGWFNSIAEFDPREGARPH